MACSRITVLVLAGACVVGGCKNDDDDDDSTTSPSSSSGSAWLVGDDGEMLRMAADGSVSSYPLDEDDDLLAIACVGTTGAWVVGAAGTVLSSTDSGQSWQSHELGIEVDLRAVAIAEDDRGEASRVVIAGDGVILSRNALGDFVALPIPVHDFTSLALDHQGTRLLAVTDEGSIFRVDGDGPAAEVATFEGQQLSGVALDAAGAIGVVVGAEGWVAMSKDGGATWQPQSVPTVRDLWAVRVSLQGDTVIAVGDAGTVLRIDERGVSADEHLDPLLALRGVHLHAEGHGHAVGDAGTVLVTDDLGRSWAPVEIGVAGILRGVDDFHATPHL